MGQEIRRARTGGTRKEFEAKLIVRAWKDDQFRRKLLKDPKLVFEELVGVSLPGNLKIKVLEESREQLYLILPQDPDQIPDFELSDEQLELVTGGSGFPVFLMAHLNPPQQ